MSFGERFLVFSCLVCAIGCTQLNNGTVADENRKSSRKSRVLTSYAGLVTCAVKYDADCFIDAAQEYLEDERTDLLAEADAAAYRATGRSDPESKPSHLVDVIGKLITELSKMFEGGFSGFFKSARENDEEDDKNILEEGENDTARANGAEPRGKKKKKKQKLLSMLKIFGLGAIIYKKLCFLLKLFHAALQFKLYLIALGGLLLNVAKFWISLKKDHAPQKVIYYEHAQHQHHYGHEDDGHSIWGRALREDDVQNSTDLEADHTPYLYFDFFEFREYNVKKKKSSKKPLKSVLRLVKVALIVGIVVLKIAVVLKVLQTAMQFKFLLISAGGFAIQAAKLWMNLRNNKNEHHEEIVYKNPYSSGGEEWQGGPGGPPGVYNARSFREVHELVYGRHKPVAT